MRWLACLVWTAAVLMSRSAEACFIPPLAMADRALATDARNREDPAIATIVDVLVLDVSRVEAAIPERGQGGWIAEGQLRQVRIGEVNERHFTFGSHEVVISSCGPDFYPASVGQVWRLYFRRSGQELVLAGYLPLRLIEDAH